MSFESPKTRFVCPPRALIPTAHEATRFLYKLPNRRVHIVLREGMAYVYFRRLLPADPAKPLAWLERIAETRLSLSLEVLHCLSHFLEHLEATPPAQGLPSPAVLYRPSLPTNTQPA